MSIETAAHAHGPPPISQQIIWQGQTMLVPAAYWGIFVGTDGGPWRWICDEAINANLSRQVTMAIDGTLFASDHTGVTVSRDGGCTFESSGPALGDPASIDALVVADLRNDPVRPRVYTIANNADGTGNGLFATDDQGMTWQRIYATPDHLPSGLRISPDGQTLVVSSVTNAMPRQAVMHVSSDGGKTFTEQPLNYQIDGMPVTFFTPLWFDPMTPGRFYLLVELDTEDVVLRLDGPMATPVEVMRTTGARVYSMDLSPAGEILIATTQGMYAAPWNTQGSASFSTLGTLSLTQCLSVHDNTLYACASDFTPDSAAIARLSADATSYRKVFQFVQTQGPIACPAGTPTASICSMYWIDYASLLGIPVGVTNSGPDGGASPAQNENSGGCEMAKEKGAACWRNTVGKGHSRSYGLLLFSSLLLLFVALRRTRREQRARRRHPPSLN